LSASPLKFFSCACLIVLIPAGIVSAGRNTARHDQTSDAVVEAPAPMNYLYGSVLQKNLIRDNKGKYGTNITFQPQYVSESMTESVLFCGDRADAFDSVDGPVVITYRRISHKMLRDVPCFDLVSVDRVEPGGRALSLK
jgi:hypothetical protein